MPASAPGQIITFYSYKGGTGRTMALANVACLLGQGLKNEDSSKRLRVLALDWDFEAPGLHHYFRPYLAGTAEGRFDASPGCLDLFALFDKRRREFSASDYVANRERSVSILTKLDFDSYLLATRIPGLQIMKAGRFDSGYARRASEFQWDRLFKKTVGLFSGFADYLRQNYDYVLVDSRTGMSDTSGICSMLLPDKLVVVFTPNQQSLTGIGDLVRKAVAYRKSSPDARPLTVFPLPSRIEMAAPPSLLEAWRTGKASQDMPRLPPDLIGYQPQFEQLFDEIYLRSGTRLSEYFDAVMLQHIPDYAYGEPIAVMLEETDSRLSLRRSYAAFAELLTTLKAPWESLAQVRLVRDIAMRCEQAHALATAGKNDAALRLAYGLMEQRPPDVLFEKVARTILEVARMVYPHSRDQVSEMLTQAAERMTNQTDLDPAQVAHILAEAGKLCLLAGDYRLAKNLLEEGLERLQTELGDDAPVALSAGDWLVTATSKMGELREARYIGERELARRRQLLGYEHPDTLSGMTNLARTLRDEGDLARARAIQSEVLEISRRTLGEEHPSTLRSMNDLASTLRAQGDLAAAQTLQDRLLEISRRVFGQDHPDTVASMNNLANTLRAQGDFSGARALQEKVLEFRRRTLGEEHPDTLASMNNLANTLVDQGDLAGGRALQDKVLEVRRRTLGEEHPDTLASMNNLASTLEAQGDLAGARAIQDKALEVSRRTLGEEHPSTLSSMNNLASTLVDQGDLAGGRALQDKALEVSRRVLGEEHPDTLSIMNNLANTLGRQGDLPAARALQERLVEVNREVRGYEHPATLTSMNNLASTLQAQGDLPNARALQERVLDVSRRVLGEEHPTTLAAMNNLASVLLAQGDLAGARTLQEEVLAVRRRLFGEKHPDTLGVMNNLASTLQAMGDLLNARALEEQVLVTSRRVLGKEHPDTKRAVLGLLAILRELGDSEAIDALVRESLGQSDDAASRPSSLD